MTTNQTIEEIINQKFDPISQKIDNINKTSFKYGDIITLKEGASPILSLDVETFLNLPDDENVKDDKKTYWSLPIEAFDFDDMGSVFLKSEYATRFRWGVDADVDDLLNINVAYDPEGNVNPGAFCSWIEKEMVN